MCKTATSYRGTFPVADSFQCLSSGQKYVSKSKMYELIEMLGTQSPVLCTKHLKKWVVRPCVCVSDRAWHPIWLCRRPAVQSMLTRWPEWRPPTCRPLADPSSTSWSSFTPEQLLLSYSNLVSASSSTQYSLCRSSDELCQFLSWFNPQLEIPDVLLTM